MATSADKTISDTVSEVEIEAEVLQDAILHPLSLTTIENQDWATQLQFATTIRNGTQPCSFQSVYLDSSSSVYIHDIRCISPSDTNCILHKCSMQKQMYYKLPTEVEGYALAVYRSKVMIIGGTMPHSSGDIRYPKYQISVLDDDCSLEELLNSTMQPPEDIYKDVYKIGKNSCAVGEEDLLIVIGGDGPHVEAFSTNNQEYIRVFNGESWSFGIIAIEGSDKIRSKLKSLIIFQNSIYMTACSETHSGVKFYCVSLEHFNSPLDSTTKLNWKRLEELSEGQCTSLSVLGNQLVTLCHDERWLRMYAYLPGRSSWTVVQEFQTPCSCIAGIIGLPCSNPSVQVEALLVGKQSNQQPTKIYKAAIKVQPYNPEGHITFLALSKLEGLANLPVLTFVERTIEQFMDTAGFQLNRCFSKRGMRIAYEYIESWKVEKSPFYKPTWSGLLSVLGVIGFDSLAQNIGKVLTDTTSSVEPLDDCKDPENVTVMDLLIKLKEGLAQLNKKNVPKRLQKGVISCTNECEGVIQKVKMEKSEIERQLESSSARIEELTSELAFYRSAIYGKGMPHQHPSLSTSKDNISKSKPPEMRDLVLILSPVISDWRFLGILLGVQPCELKRIESEYSRDNRKCFIEMLSWWLDNIPDCSWPLVAVALKSMDKRNLADEVIKTHCRKPNTQN